MQLGDGIYNTEYYTPENSNKELPFYWCKKSAEIKLVNPQLNTERYTFIFTVGDYFFDISDRPSITITFGDSSQTFVVSQENMKIRYTVDIPLVKVQSILATAASGSMPRRIPELCIL